MSLIIQTKPFPLTRPNTKPYWGQQGHKSQAYRELLFGLQVSFQVVRGGWTRPKRARGGRCSTTTGNSSECQGIQLVGDSYFPSQRTTAEHQDEAGEPSVGVRLLVQLPAHLRGQCHGEGQPEGEGLPHRWKVR